MPIDTKQLKKGAVITYCNKFKAIIRKNYTRRYPDKVLVTTFIGANNLILSVDDITAIH